MRLTADNSETNDYWAPYSPTDAAPWNLERVVHLHRRAGLGASWTELERDLREGPESSVNRLLKGEVKPHETAEGFEKTSQLLADAAVASRDPNRLKAWWVFRMLFGPDPLGERLTLVWHNHFATSNVKVDDPGLMRTQNETLRKWRVRHLESSSERCSRTQHSWPGSTPLPTARAILTKTLHVN